MEQLKQYSFSIDQKPIPQARPRVTKWGTYDPKLKEKKKYKAEIAEKWLYLPLLEPLRLKTTFVMPIPKSYGKRKICEIYENECIHCIKPDCSNLLKMIEDSMTGLVYKDDSLIFHLEATKIYGETPKIEIIIETQENLTRK